MALQRDRYLTPVFLAAWLLDHRYEGKKLDADNTQQALAIIRSVDVDIMESVTKYMIGKKPLKSEYFEDFRGVNTVSRWKMGVRLGFSEQLVVVAIVFFGIPNSAGLEGCFSTSGMTYGKLRTQMDVD